jgi:hypothetical protein
MIAAVLYNFSIPFFEKVRKSYFQPPDDSNLVSTWNGVPVGVGANTSYICNSNSVFFEMDRNVPSWNLTCVSGGVWGLPVTWPRCLPSK